MKFGKQLEKLALPRFAPYYLQYKELKKAVKVFTGQDRDAQTVLEVTHWASSFLRLGPNPEVPPEAHLQQILMRELERVSKFAELEGQALKTRLDQLVSNSAKSSDADRSKQRADLKDLGEQIVDLQSFSRLNFTGFRKTLKKFDKERKSTVGHWFMAQVARSPLMVVDYDGMLQSLNRIAMNLEIQSNKTPPAQSANQGLNNAVIITYFLDPKDAMRVKVRLAEFLPMSFAGLPAEPKSLAAATVQQSTRVRTRCVVLDSADLSVYRAHVSDDAAAVSSKQASTHLRQRVSTEGSEGIWLVQQMPGGAQRTEVLLSSADVSDLLAGKAAKLDDSSKLPRSGPASGVVPLASGKEARKAVDAALSAVKGGLQVMGQSSYQRSWFGEVASGAVVVLDEDVRMGKLTAWDGQISASSCFPQDILTIYLPQGSSEPSWLQDLSACASLFEVVGFSKAAQAMGHLNAKGLGLALPHWYHTAMDTAADTNECDESVKQPAEYIEEIVRQHSPSANVNIPGPSAHLLHEFGSVAEEDAAAGTDTVQGFRPPAPGGGGLDAPLLGRAAAEPATQRPGWFLSFVRRLQGTGGVSQADEQTEAKPVRTAIVTVQPKTMFAIERTFLEWIQFALMIAGLGLAGLHSAVGQFEEWMGRMLVVIGILVVLWSIRTFNWRAEALDQKAVTDYQDAVGPPFLMGCLIVAQAAATLQASGLINISLPGAQPTL